MTERYDFSNNKLKLRFFSVVKAYGLTYPRPLGENSSFAWKQADLNHLSLEYEK